MEKRKQTQTFLRQRKMLLALPGLIIPFLTLGFWALGGGRGTGEGKENHPTGLNPVLPDARIKEEKLAGKLNFYDLAAKDSAKRAEWMRSDPYYTSGLKSETPEALEGIAPRSTTESGRSLNPSLYDGVRMGPEEKILEKLARLQKGLEEPPPSKESTVKTIKTALRDSELSHDVNRLEDLMEGMKKASAEDPQMDRLETVMDKILDIQHPDRVRQRLQQTPMEDTEVQNTLNGEPTRTTVSLLQAPGGNEETRSGFYSLEEESREESDPTAAQAVVHGRQTLTEGAVVKLRLTQDIHIGDQPIPKGALVYGKASVSNERLRISISSLHHNNTLYPVSLEVYDLDGMAGIHIPGTLESEVAKESADRSLTGLQLTSLDPTLKAKAASAGLSAAKNLLSRKAKQVKITVKAGYRVLLKAKNASY